MEPEKKLVKTSSSECTLSAMQNNPQTQHLIPAKPGGFFQVSNIQLRDEVMFSLWEFMINVYGRKWAEQFNSFYDAEGNVSPTVHFWAQALSRIPLKRLERGLLKTMNERTSPFPPTLPEFIKLCDKEPWE
jgi:hypothetical protein